jgi:hypothetical protein
VCDCLIVERDRHVVELALDRTSRFSDRRPYFDSYVMARLFSIFLALGGSESPTSLSLSGNELEHHATAAD